MADTQLTATEIHYPETDGKPMAETDTHRDQMMDLIYCLRKWFRDDPQVYVAGNLLLYYEEGNPQASVAPDVFVVRGVEDHRRPIYRLWEEGKGPDLVIEVTSKNTKLEDLGNKRALYADMGVREYFIFDPLSEWLTPTLALYRLAGREYVPIEAGPIDSPARSRAWSSTLSKASYGSSILRRERCCRRRTRTGTSESKLRWPEPKLRWPEQRPNAKGTGKPRLAARRPGLAARRKREPNASPKKSNDFAANWKTRATGLGRPTRSPDRVH